MKFKNSVHSLLGIVALASVAVGAQLPSVLVMSRTAPRAHAPAIIHERHGKNATSSNWSGYAVTGAPGSITDVKGSWIVPAANCASSPSTSYASFWVGIDGFSSNTVEQTGTDSDCSSGTPTYYAWYEFYPHFAYYVPNMTAIHAGDVISAEVSFSGGHFTVSITDVTAGTSFSKSVKMSNAQRSSAEWIIEAPYSGGILPLADFGTVSFGSDSTHVSLTCDATVGGASAPMGSAAFAANLVEITMVASNGTTVKSQPSPLSADGTSFTDAWKNAGP